MMIKNDISWKLTKRVDFLGKDKHLKWVYLPKINQKTRTGFDGIVSFWGITNETIIPQYPEVLQKVSVSETMQWFVYRV